MAVKSTELRSGIFVILAMVALTILIFSVGNFRTRLQSMVRYTTYVHDVKFLKTHDAVTYGGFKVGEIKAIEVSPDRHGMVKITVAVESDVPVKEDASLMVKQDGILGPKYLEISPGTAGARRATDGTTLPGIVPTAFIDLGPSFEGPLARMDKMIENLNVIVGDTEFRKNISGILTETRALLTTMNEQVKQLGSVATKTGDKTQEVLTELQETLKSTRDPLAKTLKDTDELAVNLNKDAELMTRKIAQMLDDVTARLGSSADALDQLLKDSDSLIVQNNKNFYETLRGMRDTAHHLELAAKRVRANPSLLIFGAPETPEELKRADETDLRLKGRARRYDKEDPK